MSVNGVDSQPVFGPKQRYNAQSVSIPPGMASLPSPAASSLEPADRFTPVKSAAVRFGLNQGRDNGYESNLKTLVSWYWGANTEQNNPSIESLEAMARAAGFDVSRNDPTRSYQVIKDAIITLEKELDGRPLPPVVVVTESELKEHGKPQRPKAGEPHKTEYNPGFLHLRVPVDELPKLQRHPVKLTWTLESKNASAEPDVVTLDWNLVRPDHTVILEHSRQELAVFKIPIFVNGFSRVLQGTPGQSGRILIKEPEVDSHYYDGYHTISVEYPKGSGIPSPEPMRLIITPDTSYVPKEVGGNNKAWGIALQLYRMRAKANHDWGIGDYTLLRDFSDWTAGFKATTLGVSPLQAKNLQSPEAASPYSPFSKLFHNAMLIDVTEAPGFETWFEKAKLQPLPKPIAAVMKGLSVSNPVDMPSIETEAKQLRGTDSVDYAKVKALKVYALAALYNQFNQEHLAADHPTPLGKAFRDYQAHFSPISDQTPMSELRLFAIYQALATEPANVGKSWHQWDPKYSGPNRLKHLQTFADKHMDKVEFFEFMQWVAENQIRAAAYKLDTQKVPNGDYRAYYLAPFQNSDLEPNALYAKNNRRLPMGLYLDMPIGATDDFDTWMNPKLFGQGVSIGFPAGNGDPAQSWGLPPMIPSELKKAAYQPFIDAIHRGMEYGGAFRIDHVAGLHRLYAIPPGQTKENGMFIYYPRQDLMKIMALESHRHKALMIGESLGNNIPELDHDMWKFNIWPYGVKRWNYQEDGKEYDRQLMVLGNQDTTTLLGMLKNWYFDMRSMFHQDYPHNRSNEELRHVSGLITQMQQEKNRGGHPYLKPGVTFEQLQQLDPVKNKKAFAEMYNPFTIAAHKYLADTGARFVLAQPEDISPVMASVNIPGSQEAEQPGVRWENGEKITTFPNWRNRSDLPTFEELQKDATWKTVMRNFNASRPSIHQ